MHIPNISVDWKSKIKIEAELSKIFITYLNIIEDNLDCLNKLPILQRTGQAIKTKLPWTLSANNEFGI